MPQQQLRPPTAPSAEKSPAELLRLKLVESERGNALHSDHREEVASIAHAQVLELPFALAVKLVGNACTLEESLERLSRVDGGRGRHRRLGARPRGPGLRIGARWWLSRGQRAASGSRGRTFEVS